MAQRTGRTRFWTGAPSMMANWVVSMVTGVKLHDYGCSSKCLRAEVEPDVKLYSGVRRFLPAIASGGCTRSPSVRSIMASACTARPSRGVHAIRVVLDA